MTADPADDTPSWTRRVRVVTHVELTLPYDRDDGATAEQVRAALDGIAFDRPIDASTVTVRGTDDALVITYRTERPADSVGLLRQRALELGEALGVPTTDALPYWTDMLEQVRRRTRLARAAVDAVARPSAMSRDAVHALLPRDWPRRVDRLTNDTLGESKVQLLARVKRLVDDWVLAALDLDEETTS